MGRYHSSYFLSLFPNQVPEGIDLGNVEIKECCNKRHKFTLRPKDKKADFILFYDWIEQTFFIVNSKEMPKISLKRSISTEQVKRLAYWNSQDIDTLFEEMKSIIKNSKYIPGPYQVNNMMGIEIKTEVENLDETNKT